ncbi:MAG: universal stress protein, partial [Candidatus Brocadiae bacterium]|nr:universal stress protein [Candidatus Brocadiia bacterium]
RLRALQREGATGTALVRAAREEGAALLVAGTSQRAGLDRLRHGSVAGEILDGARLNLCIVPAPDDGLPAAVRYRSVLAVTDLSPLGNAAVPHAYALLPAGGTVHLLHVREVEEPGETSMIIHLPKSSNPEESARESAAAAAALSALVPESSATPGVETRIEVAEAPDAADGIRQAAERLGADAIVLATRGRSGLGKALLGSVADRVLKEAGRPVLLIRSTQA